MKTTLATLVFAIALTACGARTNTPPCAAALGVTRTAERVATSARELTERVCNVPAEDDEEQAPDVD